jgi:hypothetical protein
MSHDLPVVAAYIKPEKDQIANRNDLAEQLAQSSEGKGAEQGLIGACSHDTTLVASGHYKARTNEKVRCQPLFQLLLIVKG